MKGKWWRRALTVLCLVAGVGGGLWWYAQRTLREGQGLARHGLWNDAQRQLGRYLVFAPQDARANLLYAECLVKQDDGSDDVTVQQALEHLRRIENDSPLAAQARTQEGRLHFLVLYQPSHAERCFREAMRLDPQLIDPVYLLWKLYDLTGRSHLIEPEFWKAYELTPPEERGLRLREWYMSQFYPATANPMLDQLMGFASERQQDPARTEVLRFIRFRNEEPHAPLGYAALARWFHLEGDLEFALKTLDEAAPQIIGEEKDSFYLATLVQLLIELGEFERADQVFQQWPEPHEGYEYWLTEGMVRGEIRGEYAQAIRAYDAALAMWPGPVDWRMRNRKADCLLRSGDQKGAAAERAKAKAMEELMAEEKHSHLRELLSYLDDAEKMRQVAAFYRLIGRPREAQAWDEHIARLGKSSPALAEPGRTHP